MAKPEMASQQEPSTHRGTHMETAFEHLKAEHAKAHGKDLQTRADAIQQGREVARGQRAPRDTGNL